MPRPAHLPSQPAQRGFALLIVLWAVALLALLGSTITAAGRGEARIATDQLTAARAEAAADGAIAAAAYHLIGPAPQQWAPDGKPHLLAIGGASVTLVLQDQRGRIDVNNVPPGLIAALLRRVGVPADPAAALALAITDWRSPADTGFAAHYATLRRAYAPPHEPFRTVDELALVLGATPAILDRLRPHLSLFIEQPPQLGLADPDVAAAIGDLSRTGPDVGKGGEPGPLVVRITAAARSGSAVFRRVAVLRLADTDDQPYQILEWNGG